MDQIPLDLKLLLPYEPDCFVVHEGVRMVLERCLAAAGKGNFFVCFVTGEEKSGKTHLSVKLAAELAFRNLRPSLIEAAELPAFVSSRAGSGFDDRDVVIIDDAHLYFERISGVGSGEFVNLVESLRLGRSGLILLSALPISRLNIDDHVRSRLIPGEGYSIGNPAEADLDILWHALTKQRGLKLTRRKIENLSRRTGRDALSIAEFLDKIACSF